jgi:hypothetical protein
MDKVNPQNTETTVEAAVPSAPAEPKPKRAHRPRISDAKIAEVLRATNGAVVLAAQKLGYTRTNLWARMQKNPELQAIVQEEREGLVDLAESALKRAVLAGEGWAVCFALKCQGKGRGYVERLETNNYHHAVVDLQQLYCPPATRPDPIELAIEEVGSGGQLTVTGNGDS